ncbi:hypothetical protein ACHWQZ_G019130 [Mnemiopsis leidyi]
MESESSRDSDKICDQKNPARKSGLAAVNLRELIWTRKDIILTTLNTLVTFGDAVEIYLPGVITQSASSELGVSSSQEGLLGIILYLFLALSYFILPLIKDKIGRRGGLLISLYTSIIATVVCSKVPNYWTLLISRAVLGFCIGLNFSIAGVFYSEEVSSYGIYNVGNLIGLFAFTVGGGWVAVLAYLLLGKIGWRYFVVCTSVPIFGPPIFILHFLLDKAPKADANRENNLSLMGGDVIKVERYLGRLIKGSVANFINTLQGWGSILLIPALMNLKYGEDDENKLTEDQVLLILALLYGGAKLSGRIVSIFLLKFIPFRVLQPLLSIVIAGCYLALILQGQSLLVTVVAMGIANMCFCVTRCELTLMEFDKYHFGTERLVLAAGVMSGCGMLGAVVGAVAAQFLKSHNAVIFTFVLSCVQVVVMSCITER